MKNKWKATNIIFSVITLLLWILIGGSFVLGFFFDGYRKLIYLPVMVFGFMMNVLYAAWHLTRHEKRGYLFILFAIVCAVFVFDYYWKFPGVL